VFTPPGEPPRKGTLVTPQPEHLSTLIVLVHGGNGTNGNRNQLREWQDYYADAGYQTLSIDYFLVKPGTKPPVFDRPQQDVAAAVQYAVANAGELGIDPARIVVQGFTEGAGLGAQDLLADAGAAAAFVGVEGTYDGTQENPEQYYGGPPDDPDPEVQARYARANSIERAADANGPVFLFAAAGGPEQLVQQAQSFDGALTAAGRDSRLELVPGTGGDFESGGRELTPNGKVVADTVLAWLEDLFPN
jgi:acetyl esterase/lipase